MTLGKRIPEGNAGDGPIDRPMEITWYLTGALDAHDRRFGWREFVERGSEIEFVDPQDAADRAWWSIDRVHEEVRLSDFCDRDILPAGAGQENCRTPVESGNGGGWEGRRERARAQSEGVGAG